MRTQSGFPLAIVGNDPPDFRTISDFRKIHLAAFRPLFLEVLRLAGEMGMVKLGNLSTDGTKMGANASRHKAMSYGYMNKEIERLEGEIEQLLQQAEQLDAEQDAALGSRRGDELPDELKRREGRLAKIREAKWCRDWKRRPAKAEEQRRRDEEQAQREAEGRQRRGKGPAPIDPTPEDKAQTNFTDPEAKIMKQSNKGFDYSYNAQAVVDSKHQIIVAAEATNAANDKEQAVPMGASSLEQPRRGRDRAAKGADGIREALPSTADTGYFSGKAVEGLRRSASTRTSPSVAKSTTKPGSARVGASAEASSGRRRCMQPVRRPAKLSTRHASTSSNRYSVKSNAAGNPNVSVARTEEGVSRVATDMFTHNLLKICQPLPPPPPTPPLRC